MNIKLIAISALALQLAACATVTRGKHQNVEFSSSPSEATVTLTEAITGSQQQSCQTPCELEMKRKDTFKLLVEKAGFESFEMIMKSKVSTGGGAAAAGNLLAGGIIGGIVDGSSGAMRSFSPDPINVQLAPAGEGQSRLMETEIEEEKSDEDS